MQNSLESSPSCVGQKCRSEADGAASADENTDTPFGGLEKQRPCEERVGKFTARKVLCLTCINDATEGNLFAATFLCELALLSKKVVMRAAYPHFLPTHISSDGTPSR
jgi:hypothetical protein